MDRFTLSFDSLKAWCQRQNYEFSENAELGQLAIHYQLLGQRTPVMVLPEPARGMVMFVMRQPFVVATERQAAMLEAVNHLNASTYMGAWSLNRERGEVFFRVTVPALDIAYTDAGVLHVARVAVGTSERAAPALRAIALENADPIPTIVAITDQR
jgi:hypothetical protein